MDPGGRGTVGGGARGAITPLHRCTPGTSRTPGHSAHPHPAAHLAQQGEGLLLILHIFDLEDALHALTAVDVTYKHVRGVGGDDTQAPLGAAEEVTRGKEAYEMGGTPGAWGGASSPQPPMPPPA